MEGEANDKHTHALRHDAEEDFPQPFGGNVFAWTMSYAVISAAAAALVTDCALPGR